MVNPTQVSLVNLILSALAELAQVDGVPSELKQLTHRPFPIGADWRGILWRYLSDAPCAEDEPLFILQCKLGLTPLEMMSVTLALCVERDTRVNRAVTVLQHPVEGVGPTLGLLQLLFARDAEGHGLWVESLLQGAALESGLLELHNPTAPLVERSLRVPTHLIVALAGVTVTREGFSFDAHEDEVPLPPSATKEAQRYAAGLAQGADRALILRAGASKEGRAIARELARALGLAPLFITSTTVLGLAPWLYLKGWLPVFEQQLGPNERFRVPAIARYRGPVVVLPGRDGNVELSRGSALTWSIAIPAPAERQMLWQQALGDDSLAARLAPLHRHGISRIAELGSLARQRATMDRRPVDRSDLLEVALMSSAGGLSDLAEPVLTAVAADSLVLPAATRRELELLVTRCRLREALTTGLGTSAKARYRPGVRALFTGNSGTGKTLAASWLATELGSPLYRVDVASVVSKYIGETEKNLAQLLARAEHSEVMLLFDEADSLFGKRTEVRQANDRFANTQTNYLLQRMESYEGIVILTSNNRSRFDSAFTRRLDFVIDFPEPRPEERRDLWLGHLGTRHELVQEQINQLSMAAELCGGNIRNVVLCAAVLAQQANRVIAWEDIYEGLNVEYRKLGKQVPAMLRSTATQPRS